MRDAERRLFNSLLQAKGVATGRRTTVRRLSDTRNSPLSYSQERLWFLHQMEPEGAAYNIPAAIRLKGNFRPAEFRRTLNEIVRRHEVLRTRILVKDGKPIQEVLDVTAVQDRTDPSHPVLNSKGS
ncbi:condensation domain-containing protein [uncultured Paludibaculum sp.]|uniref:condensation domain-containing protein n=1 Tax=uncultured Paludibaculum sp. TaxID=1765020 RepID=UPI00374D8E5C